MNFSVDNELRKDIKKRERKRHKAIYIFWIIEKTLLLLTIITIVCFPLYCILTGEYIYTVERTGETSYFLVCMFTSVYSGGEFTLWIIIWAARRRLEELFMGGRVDEMIELNDSMLFYTFRIQYQSSANKRNLVIVNLNKIDKLNFDEELREIVVFGEMIEKVINVSKRLQDVDASEMSMSELHITDYFSPSLYEKMKQYIS